MKTLQLKYSLVKIEARLYVDVSVTFYAFVKYTVLLYLIYNGPLVFLFETLPLEKLII